MAAAAASSIRFWRSESFFRFDSCPIRGSRPVRRFAVKSNSVRVGGSSTELRSWSWQLVRSRTAAGPSSSVAAAAAGSPPASGADLVRLSAMPRGDRWRDFEKRREESSLVCFGFASLCWRSHCVEEGIGPMGPLFLLGLPKAQLALPRMSEQAILCSCILKLGSKLLTRLRMV